MLPDPFNNIYEPATDKNKLSFLHISFSPLWNSKRYPDCGRNLLRFKCRPANLEESFWVPGEFQFGRGLCIRSIPHSPPYHPVIQHNKSAAKKTIQSYFLDKNSINEKRSLHFASFSTSKEYIYIFKAPIKVSIYLLPVAHTALPHSLATWPFWAEHHWSLPLTDNPPLQPCSPFLSPKRLSCQCSVLGLVFGNETENRHDYFIPARLVGWLAAIVGIICYVSSL